MKDKDTKLLEEAYTSINEAFPGQFKYWEVEEHLAKKYSPEAVAVALESIEDEHGLNGIDAWHDGTIDVESFEEMVKDAYNPEEKVSFSLPENFNVNIMDGKLNIQIGPNSSSIPLTYIKGSGDLAKYIMQTVEKYNIEQTMEYGKMVQGED